MTIKKRTQQGQTRAITSTDKVLESLAGLFDALAELARETAKTIREERED